MWTIDKTFEFCYGHRVWTQVLDGRFADDLKCACRHLHGHEGKVQIFLESPTLNAQGMITDFRHLEWLKKWLNNYVDHKFILDRSDPVKELLFPQLELVPVEVPDTDLIVAYTAKSNPSSVLSEIFEGLLLVDFSPTSENLAKWLLELTQARMSILGVKVSRVDWYETPRSRSSYGQS